MATAKKAAPAKKAASVKVIAPAKKAAGPAALKPIKIEFNKSTLQAHLAEATGAEPMTVKAVLAALEATMVTSLSKKGLGGFTLPGLLKISAIAIPAKEASRH